MTQSQGSPLSTVFSDERIRSGLVCNLTGTMAGRSACLVTSIILARLLGQAAFGAFSIIQSTILTFGVFSGFGPGLPATKHIAVSFRKNSLRSGRLLVVATVLASFFAVVISAVNREEGTHVSSGR